MSASNRLIEVALAIADGTPIDWRTATDTVPSDADRRLLRELQFIAGVRYVESAWGPFRLLERVGAGTSGEVYRAWDTRLDREVALKLLRRDDRDVGANAAALREGRALARVRHPNVVVVYGADAVDGQVGLSMEFVRGRTLAAEVQRSGRLAADVAADAGIAVANAVAAVHAAGLVHRDVKAQNVLRADDGRLLLADLGAGCEAVDPPAGELAGTPAYLAPEVLAGGAASAASDVYSIGVLLFHLLTGAFPVSGRTLAAIRAAHQEGVRTTLRQARADVPPRLAEVVDRALDPNPERRIPTAGALAAALTKARRVPPRLVVLLPLAGLLIGAVLLALLSLAAGSLSSNPSAVAAYTKGRALLDPHRYANRDVRRAAAFFEQAIAEDPEFGAAHAGLAEALALMSIGYGGIAPASTLATIQTAATRAVELAPRLPEAHTAMGIAAARRLSWDAAEAEFRIALDLDRRRSPTYVAYALAALFPQGKLDDAVRVLTTALDYDPLPREVHRALAWVLVSRREYDRVIEHATVVEAADPDLHVRQVHARALFHRGDTAEAIRMLEELGAPSRGFLAYTYARVGRTADAEAIARADAALPARAALAYAGLGHSDGVFAALNRMIDAGEPRAGIYLTFPEFDALRGDQRFAALRVRLKLR